MTEIENTRELMFKLEQELGVKGPAPVLRAALALAKEASKQAREAEPPAPPAWMVEVAREGAAKLVDARLPEWAARCRSGGCDDHANVQVAIAALRLALERGHVVEAREALTESFVSEDDPLFNPIWDVIKGWDIGDLAKHGGYRGATGDHVRAIIRAVRAVAAPAAFSVDLEPPLKRAWADGFSSAICALNNLADGEGNATTLYANEREKDVFSILSTLPTREA